MQWAAVKSQLSLINEAPHWKNILPGLVSIAMRIWKFIQKKKCIIYELKIVYFHQLTNHVWKFHSISLFAAHYSIII